MESHGQVDWSSFWIDLSEWQGQHVTLTMQLEQAVGEPFSRLRLDDISIGSWLTPQISSVSPSQIPPETYLPVTISGENFIDTPSVTVGGLLASQVNMVDEHTLIALLPSVLVPGIYPLVVTNPGGQQAVYPALNVGEHIFIPLTMKYLYP